MKILHVISSVDPRHGGPIDSVNTLSAVWMREGHTCQVASLDQPDVTWVKHSPVPVVALGSEMFRSLPGAGYGYSPRLAAWLARHAGNFDAALVHGLWNYASLGAWRGLHGSMTPFFVFPHGMLDPWFNEAYPVKALYKSAFWLLFERRVLRDARGVLFTAAEERDLAQRSFRPYAARPHVVGLGTRDVGGDPARQREAFASAMPKLAGRRFVLFLSRIHPKKGPDLLIEGFARVAAQAADLDLVVAGPDQVGLQRSLEERAARLGVGHRVHWPGMLTGDVKWGAFRSAELFALPSHQENFGIVIAEALAVGTPVLITRKVNIWREIEQDGAGLVVNDDADGVAEGLTRFAAMSAEARAHMATAARQSFLRRYDIEAVAAGLLRLMAETAKDERRHEDSASS